MGVIVRPLLIETRSTPAYCCLIGDIENQDELPWYHDIYQFLSCGAYLETTTAKDRRALRQLPPYLLFMGMPFIGDHPMAYYYYVWIAPLQIE